MATVRRTTPVRTKAATEKMIAQLTQDIEALDTKLAKMSKEQEQFLLGSCVSQKVQHSSFGEGTIISQKEDMITVSFSKDGLVKAFLIHRKYTNRPQFGKDEETISAFSDCVDRRLTINHMNQEKARLERQRAELLQE